MAEAVRIEAECDGVAAPWERGRPLYRFVPGTVLLLLRNDDPRFLKVAYDGKLVFVPRDACVEVGVTTSAGLTDPHAGRLKLEDDRPPRRPWAAREWIAAFWLGLLVPGMFIGLMIAFDPASNFTFAIPLLVWVLTVPALGLVARLVASARSALWGTALGVAITAALFLTCLAALSSADI